MSANENIIARWSRRKRGLTGEGRQTTSKEGNAAGLAPEIKEPAREPETELGFRQADLPAIESITADSNIGAFLNSRVPAELTRRALRRAWSADPAIRDFIGLSENSWDFNASGGVPGFGTLNIEDVRELVDRVMGKPDVELNSSAARSPVPETVAEASASERDKHAGQDTLPPAADVVPAQGLGNGAAADFSAASEGVFDEEVEQIDRKGGTPKRRHGSALPT